MVSEETAVPLAIILRGLPGSGKSHWVNELLAAQAAEDAEKVVVCSTDNLFMEQGEYRFDATRLSEYHQRNLAGFIEALALHTPVVICDNTNMARWEFLCYETAARALGYRVERKLIGEPWNSQHQQICAARNRHGVSLEAIRRMAAQFEAD
ncbi:AAA family ATPase [Shewanella cyperi]|uniref:AAA family ATPase n=1 Tax=Shewanella cyperi TaxID=2814292 RepID=A0A974XMY6_9GAMM|nr:AAA family ATPase [Shewanella cyperi]QSX31356.1 AAA family ATPase [Shewanella cyperi]